MEKVASQFLFGCAPALRKTTKKCTDLKPPTPVQALGALEHVLDGFAEVFERVVAQSKAQLRGELHEDFISEIKVEIVRFLHAIHDYAWDLDVDLSQQVKEQLVCLLISTDPEILVLVLEVLAAFQRQRSSPSEDYSGGFFNYLAQGWAGDGQPLDLMSCISGCSKDQRLDQQLASSLYFEFYEDRLHIIHVEKPGLEECLGLFNRLVREAHVPIDLRFALLTRIRFSRAFTNIESRHLYVKILTLAMELEKFHKCPRRTELLQQLPRVVLAETVPRDIRVLALYAMKSHDLENEEVVQLMESSTEAFLNGDKNISIDYLKALVFYSPQAKVLTRLGVVQNNLALVMFASRFSDGSFSNIDLASLKAQLLLKENHNKEILCYLATWVRAVKDLNDLLVSCLLVIFNDMRHFNGPVLREAATKLLSRNAIYVDAKNEFIRQMLSTLASGENVDPKTISCFLKILEQESATSATVSRLIRKNPQQHQHWLHRGLAEQSFANRIIQDGGFKFLTALPFLAASKLDELKPIQLSVRPGVYQTFAAKFAQRFRLSENYQTKGHVQDFKNLEQLARMLHWLLFHCCGHDCIVLIEKLEKEAALDRLLATFEALAVLPTSRDMDIYFKILNRIMEVACNVRIKHQVGEAVWHAIRHCSEITPVMASAVAKLGRHPTIKAVDFLVLKQPVCRDPCFRDVLIEVWKRSRIDQRRTFFSALMLNLEEDCRVCSFLAHLLMPGGPDHDAAKIALEIGLASRVVKLLSSTESHAAMADILTILNHLFRRPGGESAHHKERKQAALWLIKFIFTQEASLHAFQILKLGETLAINLQVDDHGNLTALFSRIFELISFTVDGKVHAFNMLMNLLDNSKPVLDEPVAKFMERFALLFDIAQSDVTVEFFLEVFDAFPESLQRISSAPLVNLLVRVCKDDDKISVKLFQNFFTRVGKERDVRVAISRAATDAPSTVGLIKILNLLRRKCDSMDKYANVMLDALSLLDSDHPEAVKVAAYIFSVLRTGEQEETAAPYVPLCRKRRTMPSPSAAPPLLSDGILLKPSHLTMIVKFIWNESPLLDVEDLLFLVNDVPEEHAVMLLKLLVEPIDQKPPQVYRRRDTTFHGNGLWSRCSSVSNTVLQRIHRVVLKLVRDGPSRLRCTIAAFMSLTVEETILDGHVPSVVHELVNIAGPEKLIKLSDRVLVGLCPLLFSNSLSTELTALVEQLEINTHLRLVSLIANSAPCLVKSYSEKIKRGEHHCVRDLLSFLRLFQRLTARTDDLKPAQDKLCSALNSLWKTIPKGVFTEDFVEAVLVCHSMSSRTDISRSTEYINTTFLLGQRARDIYSCPIALSFLQQCPGAVDLTTKIKLLRSKVSFLSLDRGTEMVNIRRDHMLDDSLVANLASMRKIVVNYANEIAYDEGGLAREWFELLPREFARSGLFSDIGGCYQPNPSSRFPLSYFGFAGRLAAKAIIDDQRLGINFTRSFYKHILGIKIVYRDMEIVNPEVYKNIEYLFKNNIDGLHLGLTFSVDRVDDKTMKVVTRNLVCNGQNIEVTDENKRDYARLIIDYWLTDSIKPQIDAFVAGFGKLVDIKYLSIFNAEELEQLLSGRRDINVMDIRQASKLENYDKSSPVVCWFWEVFQKLSKDDKGFLLQFATGSSKVSLSGPPVLTLMRTAYSSSLPVAHTCDNFIQLPEYNSKEELKTKLLLAIREGCEGFAFR